MRLSVAHTEEFRRVAGLRRRRLDAATAGKWAADLDPIFALRDGVHLRPWQAAALVEAVEVGGAWCALPVGLGKTLISWLLPTAMQSERALLLVPGALAGKTRADFAEYVGTWRAPANQLQIKTRERLATVRGAGILTEYRPDLIIIDEADKLSNVKSSAARRIDRYVTEASPRVVAMTGTPSRKSILDYWHLLVWCLGDGAPIPLGRDEAALWSMALDEQRHGAQADPGPLGGSLKAAGRWYRQRLVETPGVVVVDEDSCDAPLTIRTRIAREDPILNAAFERFLIEQENPGGIPVSDPLSRWRLDGDLGLGLYSRWNPPPPEDWREAGRAAARFVRERIDATTHSARPLDTEAQVFRRYDTHPIVTDWRRLKPTFAGTTETVWISRSAIDSALDWLRDLDGVPGIVWSGSIPFGIALANETGLAYYGPKGKTAGGADLRFAPVSASLVASWKANATGFNLQPWSRQLVVMPPQSAKAFEQVVGRSHRSGQNEHVIVDILATSGGTLDLFESAIGEAARVRRNEGLTQKILRADIVRAEPTTTLANEFRWARKDADR